MELIDGMFQLFFVKHILQKSWLKVAGFSFFFLVCILLVGLFQQISYSHIITGSQWVRELIAWSGHLDHLHFEVSLLGHGITVAHRLCVCCAVPWIHLFKMMCQMCYTTSFTAHLQVVWCRGRQASLTTHQDVRILCQSCQCYLMTIKAPLQFWYWPWYNDNWHPFSNPLT